MLSLCRRECRDFYSNLPESHLDWDILDYGGLKDLLPQPFGFQLPVCSLREGYHHAQMVAKQVDFVKKIPELARFVPAFTDVGFLKTKLPESLFQDVVAARDHAISNGMISTEEPDFGILNGPVVIENPILEKCKDIIVPRTQLINIGTNIRKSILESLGPLAENWAQLKLRPSSLYGIRRYLNMSTLLAHVDKVGSHVISAIINVGQEVEEDWPLYIKDNRGEEHTVLMEPGDMVWYESAREVSTFQMYFLSSQKLKSGQKRFNLSSGLKKCGARLVHSRQKPLRGSHYDNLFVHFLPEGLWYDNSLISTDLPVMKISAEAVRQSPALQRSETKSLSQIKTLNMLDNIRNFYAWVTIEIIK